MPKSRALPISPDHKPQSNEFLRAQWQAVAATVKRYESNESGHQHHSYTHPAYMDLVRLCACVINAFDSGVALHRRMQSLLQASALEVKCIGGLDSAFFHGAGMDQRADYARDLDTVRSALRVAESFAFERLREYASEHV